MQILTCYMVWVDQIDTNSSREHTDSKVQMGLQMFKLLIELLSKLFFISGNTEELSPDGPTTERKDRATERAETHPWQCFLFVESVLGFDGRFPGAVSEERTTWNRGTPGELMRYTLGGEENNKTGEFTWWSHQTFSMAADRKTTRKVELRIARPAQLYCPECHVLSTSPASPASVRPPEQLWQQWPQKERDCRSATSHRRGDARGTEISVGQDEESEGKVEDRM